MKASIYIYEPGASSTEELEHVKQVTTLDDIVINGPKVSCLMVTRGNVAYVSSAVKCFNAQTYKNKELIIIYDNPTDEFLDYVETLESTEIRAFEVRHFQWRTKLFFSLCFYSPYYGYFPLRALARALLKTPKPALGLLRNIAVAKATGEVICQWDDDDLYGRDRLAVQVTALLRCGLSAVFLKRWLVWWPAREIFALSNARIWEGSIVAWKKAVPPYPTLASRAEDTMAVNSMCKVRKVGLLDMPTLYCYVIHGANTWDSAHFEKILAKCEVRYDYQEGLRSFRNDIPFDWHPQAQAATSQAS